jgi:hypothetical protein
MAIRFLWENYVDASPTVISASSEGSDLPASNVQHPHRQQVWRTGTAASLEWIKFDLGSARAIKAFAAINHNLVAGDSLIKIQANASDSWGSPSVDVTIPYNAGNLVNYWTSFQQYRWWRFTFTKSSSSVTRDVGRIYLGSFYEAAKNISYEGLTIKPVDLSITERTPGGQTYSKAEGIFNEIETDFDFFGDAQMEQFLSMLSAVGTHTPIIIDGDRANMGYKWFYYVKVLEVAERRPRMYVSGLPLWSTKWRFAEEL